MRAAGQLLLGFLFAASACTPTSSRLPPYDRVAEAQNSLALRAQEQCRCQRGGEDLPPLAFTTDGCSMSPDGDRSSCCIEHDIAYWCGGSAEQRKAADRKLADCVIAKGHGRSFAAFVRLSVRAGGVPWLPFPWRWGYGWPGPRGYDRDTEIRDCRS